jgi:uncharacterized membrane protein
LDNIALIVHSLSAAVLVGGMVLLFFAVTPATWILADEEVRRAVTRVVTRRFAVMTVIALGLLLVTGLYQFMSDTVTPAAVREDMMAFRFGPVFMAKILFTVALVILIGVHGMRSGPRIARATDAVIAAPDDDEARWELENLRRTSLIFSFVMLVIGVVVLAMGVTLGNHGYAHIPID